MSSSQKEEHSENSVQVRFKRCIDAYKTSMKRAMTAQPVLNLSQLSDEHFNITEKIIEGIVDEEVMDLKYVLYDHHLNLVEPLENITWHNSVEKLNEAYLCIYFTRDWIYVAGYTKTLGSVNIDFGNPHGKRGFAARLKHNDGKLAWSDDYDNLTEDKEGKALQVVDLLIAIGGGGSEQENETDRNLVQELFKGMKISVDRKMKEAIFQVVLITPEDFGYLGYREVLRESCKQAGFKRILTVSDYSIAASTIFSNLQLDEPKADHLSVLVVVIYYSYIVLYILGGNESTHEINGVHLLAAAYCDPVSKESVKSGYKRALTQMPALWRDSTRHYVVLDDYGYFSIEAMVDEVFHYGEKLTKSENIMGNKLNEIFSHFKGNPSTGSYKLGPDSDNQAEFNKNVVDHEKEVSKIESLNISENSAGPIQLIGKCIALKNGTEVVDGMKQGSLVFARLDLEDLFMGEVGLTCKINGYGDTVYVEVKFCKPLALGTTGIKILHIDVAEGFCDKCKGKRSIFIPLELIGSSKDHLFQVH